jgi:hypothetical protein
MMDLRKRIGCFGLLASLAMSGLAFAQNPAITTSTSGSTDPLTAFQQGQSALVQQWETLISQGATPDQINTWRQQDAAQFQAQQQLAESLGLTSSLRPIPLLSSTNAPAIASGTLADFASAQAMLANARARIRNRLLQAMSSGASRQQLFQMEQQTDQQFQQQHALDLQLQQKRAQFIAGETASKALQAPTASANLSNVPPKLQAFISARNALLNQWIQVWNQYAGADAAVRDAALQQWKQQNIQKLEQLQALAADLSSSNVN